MNKILPKIYPSDWIRMTATYIHADFLLYLSRRNVQFSAFILVLDDCPSSSKLTFVRRMFLRQHRPLINTQSYIRAF